MNGKKFMDVLKTERYRKWEKKTTPITLIILISFVIYYIATWDANIILGLIIILIFMAIIDLLVVWKLMKNTAETKTTIEKETPETEKDFEIRYVEVEGREVKVIILPMPPLMTGCYELKTDMIFINKRLLRFPNIYQNTLEHEMEHAKYRDESFYQSWIDLRDVFTPKPKNWPEYVQESMPTDYRILKANLLTWTIIFLVLLIGLKVFDLIVGGLF